jgi:hypothetical protein
MAKDGTSVLHRLDDFKAPAGKGILCRLSYANGLFKARSQEEGKPPRFGATLIFSNAQKSELGKMIQKLIEETPGWGAKGLERFKAGLIKNPILAGDGKEARDSGTGEIKPGLGAEFFFIRPGASADRPPAVWWKDPNKQETEATVYSGCYGKAILNVYSYKHPKSGDGVTFGISGFQKIQEGDRLGGGGAIDKEKWSETIADEGEAPAETAGGKGAGGLFGD